MTRFNLSEWALGHRAFVVFLMIASVIAGAFAYRKLGREEDPSFAIKTMVVVAVWPGASIDDTLYQVTDRIEKEIQQIDSLDYTRSYTVPGRTTVFVQFRDTTDPKKLPDLFYQVRKHINDIRGTFPDTLQSIGFNDQFGDVFGNVYAFTSDGLSERQLRDYVEGVRTAVLHVNDVGKTELIGTQDEAIYLDISARKLAGLKIDIVSLIRTLQAQNAVSPSGVIQAGAEQVSVRVDGQFVSQESLKAINLRINDQFFRLADVADIRRGYVDPPQPTFRFNGQPAIGLAIAMRRGGNLLDFGDAPEGEDARGRGDAAYRRWRASRFRPAPRRQGGGRRLYRSAGRGDRDRASGELPEPRRAGRPRRLDLDPSRPRRDLRRSSRMGHIAAAHLAGRAHHRAGSARRRRHDHRRDDGGPAGSRGL